MSTETILQKKKRVYKFKKEETMLVLRGYQANPTSWSLILEDVKSNIDQLSPEARVLYTSATSKQLKDRISAKFGQLLLQGTKIKDIEIRNEISKIKAVEKRHVDSTVQQEPQQDRRDQLVNGMSDDSDDEAAPRHQAAPPVQAAPPHQAAPPVQAAPPRQAAPPVQAAPPIQAAQPVQAVAPHQAGKPVQAAPPRQAAPPVRAAPPIQAAQPVQAAAPQQQVPQDGVQIPNPQPGPANNRRAGRRAAKRPLSAIIRDNQLAYNRFITKKVPKILRELGISSSDDE